MTHTSSPLFLNGTTPGVDQSTPGVVVSRRRSIKHDRPDIGLKYLFRIGMSNQWKAQPEQDKVKQD